MTWIIYLVRSLLQNRQIVNWISTRSQCLIPLVSVIDMYYCSMMSQSYSWRVGSLFGNPAPVDYSFMPYRLSSLPANSAIKFPDWSFWNNVHRIMIPSFVSISLKCPHMGAISNIPSKYLDLLKLAICSTGVWIYRMCCYCVLNLSAIFCNVLTIS